MFVSFNDVFFGSEKKNINMWMKVVVIVMIVGLGG